MQCSSCRYLSIILRGQFNTAAVPCLNLFVLLEPIVATTGARWSAGSPRRIFPTRFLVRNSVYGNFAKLHPYFKRCASGSQRERPCARILRNFRENTVAPYATLPYARASKAHRPTKPTKPTKLNLLNLLNGPSRDQPRRPPRRAKVE